MKMEFFLLIVLGCCAQTSSSPPQKHNGLRESWRRYASIPGTGALSLDAANWEFTAFVGHAPVLTNNATGNLSFQFPSVPQFVAGNDTASVNYLETPTHSPLAERSIISITLSTLTTGSPVYNYQMDSDNTCVSDAKARPIIDTGGPGEFDRWWSNPVAYDLPDGRTVTLLIPLTPDHWSSVYGQLGNASAEAEAGFSQALAKVHFLGLTFGGGCFFGHGVSVSNGTAELQILNFSVLP